jgi:hypothetical protein
VHEGSGVVCEFGKFDTHYDTRASAAWVLASQLEGSRRLLLSGSSGRSVSSDGAARESGSGQPAHVHHFVFKKEAFFGIKFDFKVQAMSVHGEAARLGVRNGDVLVAVDGVWLPGMSRMADIVSLLAQKRRPCMLTMVRGLLSTTPRPEDSPRVCHEAGCLTRETARVVYSGAHSLRQDATAKWYCPVHYPKRG